MATSELELFNEYRNPRPGTGAAPPAAAPAATAAPAPAPGLGITRPAPVAPKAPAALFQSPVPRAPDLLAAQVNPVNTAMVARKGPLPSAPTAPNLTTSLGAAPPSNTIKFVLPPEPIAATTSPGAAPPAPPPAPPAAPAAAAPAGQPRVAPQSAVKYSGDPLYPNAKGPAPARPAAGAARRPAAPAAAAPAAAPQPMGPAKPTASQRATQGFKDVTGIGGEPGKVGKAAAKVGMGALKVAGRLAAPAAAVSEGVDVATVARDPSSSGLDVATQAAQGTGRLAAAGAGAGVGAAVGSAVLPGPGTVVGGLVGGAAGYFGADKLIAEARQRMGLDPRAPVDQIPQAGAAAAAPAVAAPAVAAPAPAPAAPVAPAPAVAPATAQAPAATAVPPAAPAPAPGQVVRVGNSYSGTNVSGDVSFVDAAGRPVAARGGFVGAGGGAAAPQIGVGPGVDEALYAARAQAIARGDIEGVKASYGGDFGPKTNPVDQLVNNGRPMTSRKAATIAQLQAAQNQTTAAKDQRQLERDKFGLEATGMRLDNEGKAQLGALRKTLTDPRSTKEQKDAARAAINTINGKEPKELPNRFTPFNLPDTVGDMGQVIRGGQAVLDNQTGQVVASPQQAQALPPGLVVGAKYSKGDGTYQAAGKTVVVRNGVVTEIK